VYGEGGREINFCLEEEKSRFFVGEDIILPHIKFQIGIKRFHIPKYTFLQNRNTNFLCIRGRMISSPTNLRSLNLVNPNLSYKLTKKVNAVTLVFLNYALDLIFGMCYNRNQNSRSVYFWKILRNQRASSPERPPVVRSRKI
jgi:hypothetical protein